MLTWPIFRTTATRRTPMRNSSRRFEPDIMCSVALNRAGMCLMLSSRQNKHGRIRTWVSNNALLEAKQAWEDKDLDTTIIPTYDTETLGSWVTEHEETLTKYKIDLSPSASRCTINLQDHETSCSAYRLEF
uniref:Microtubule-associated protein futsch n=1 Tax=Cacopsylla melanoneura TaxID=428564 RepID=A0A8D8XMY9_9HEMI